MLKEICSSLLLGLIAGPVHAQFVTVTQTISGATWANYGIASGLGYGQTITTDWTFRGLVDLSAPNQYGWPAEGGAYAASVTLTQPTLGLVGEPILNMGYIYLFPDQIGFSASVNGSYPWTRTKFTNSVFSEFINLPLAPGTALSAGFHNWNGFGPQWAGFALANGAHIYGLAYDGTSTITVELAAQVPEPSTAVLMVVGIAGASVNAARRRRVSRAA